MGFIKKTFTTTTPSKEKTPETPDASEAAYASKEGIKASPKTTMYVQSKTACGLPIKVRVRVRNHVCAEQDSVMPAVVWVEAAQEDAVEQPE